MQMLGIRSSAVGVQYQPELKLKARRKLKAFQKFGVSILAGKVVAQQYRVSMLSRLADEGGCCKILWFISKLLFFCLQALDMRHGFSSRQQLESGVII